MSAHRGRHRRQGNPVTPERLFYEPDGVRIPCRVDGCETLAVAGVRLCREHWDLQMTLEIAPRWLSAGTVIL